MGTIAYYMGRWSAITRKTINTWLPVAPSVIWAFLCHLRGVAASSQHPGDFSNGCSRFDLGTTISSCGVVRQVNDLGLILNKPIVHGLPLSAAVAGFGRHG